MSKLLLFELFLAGILTFSNAVDATESATQAPAADGGWPSLFSNPIGFLDKTAAKGLEFVNYITPLKWFKSKDGPKPLLPPAEIKNPFESGELDK